MDPDYQKRLEDISRWYSNRNWGFYTKLVHMGFQTISPYFRKGNVLEIGPADGEMTKLLLSKFDDITVVDAVKKYVEKVKKLDSRVKGFVSLIENFQAHQRYDNIILAHVLEHLARPRSVLTRIKDMLTKDGALFIIEPNAMSLHRQVGVEMGIIKKVTDLDEADIAVNHKRVYTSKTLKREIYRAGYTIERWGGIFLKPISNRQIEEQWSDELIDGFYKLGRKYPKIAAEIFVVCTKKK